MSSNRSSSGPANSTMPLRGAASVISATMAATSSAAMGWNRQGGSLTTVPSATRSGDAADEFEELGRANDGVRMPDATIESFLRDLGTEIAVVRPVCCDDGERDMVPYTRRTLRREKVVPRGLEEFQHRLVFK